MDKFTTHSASKVDRTNRDGMGAGIDGEEALKKGLEKPLNCKQCTREQEPIVNGTGRGGEGVPTGVYGHIDSEWDEKGTNRAGNGQWSKTGGKKGGKVQEKGGKGDTKSLLKSLENRSHCGELHQEELDQKSER